MIIYAVPTHELASEVQTRFEELGVDVEVWKGRKRPVDDLEPDGDPMCLNLENAEAAIELGLNTYKTVCKSETHQCVFFSQCEYVAQMQKQPEVWIITSNMLFVAEESFKNAEFIVIDESFVLKGLRGIENEQSYTVPLEALEHESADGDNKYILARDGHRRKLAAALRMHEGDVDDDDGGGVELDVLDRGEITADLLGEALALEWKVRDDVLLPQLDIKQLGRAVKSSLGHEIKMAMKMTKIYGELQHVVDRAIQKSGRVRLKMDNGARTVTWRGVEKIKQPFQIPTLIMDAMLPDKKILEAYYPQIEVEPPRAASLRAADGYAM